MEDLFEGLPPPSTKPEPQDEDIFAPPLSNGRKRQHLLLKVPPVVPAPPPPPPPKSALKSALKRPKLESWNAEDAAPKLEGSNAEDAAPKRRIRFNTMEDTPEQQVIDAMKKIASHVGSPEKFSKAAKLAVQLIQAGRVQPSNSDYFFSILESAMSSPITCTDPSVRADFHALFTAAQEVAYCFNMRQQRQFNVWTLRAVVANDLFTDDSFLFSRTATYIREAINGLPYASEAQDKYEAASPTDKKDLDNAELPVKPKPPSVSDSKDGKAEESDPFGLDNLIPSAATRGDKTRVKIETEDLQTVEEEEGRRILKAQREALLTCLEIAARRYKTPWCQTTIDIMAKHAFDSVERFTSKQREAVRKLWNSIREQQTRRKQGKSVSGELDVGAFEWLQQKYSTEKISIRRAVGGSGERKCEQWLG